MRTWAGRVNRSVRAVDTHYYVRVARSRRARTGGREISDHAPAVQARHPGEVDQARALRGVRRARGDVLLADPEPAGRAAGVAAVAGRGRDDRVPRAGLP